MKRSKLVVIDDDPDVQDLLVGFFRPKGFELVTFDDAEEALKAITSTDDFCDVIISDLRLPKMSGVELTTALLEKGITTPLVIMTAHRSAEVALEAIEAGAYDFVVKPLHFPQLQVSVERALHFSRMRDENTALRAVVGGNDAGPMQGIIGKAPKFLRALDLAKRVANSTAHVLVSVRVGAEKKWSRKRFTSSAPVKKVRLWRSIVRRFRKTSLKRSCSVMPKGRSPAPSKNASVFSKKRLAEPFSSTRSGI